MFVRTINQSNGKVIILIVENIREGDKVRQKKLRQVATVLPAEVERFRELAEYIKAEMEHERLPKLFPSQTLAEMVISSRNRSIGDDTPSLPVNMYNMREEHRIVTSTYMEQPKIYSALKFKQTNPKMRKKAVVPHK